MNTNGASRCPVCHLEPLLTKEPYSTTYAAEPHFVLECPPHGYIAIGATLEQVISHWNIFIDHCQRQRHIPFAIKEPMPNTTPCWHCRKNTPGTVLMEPMRYRVECQECKLIKQEVDL